LSNKDKSLLLTKDELIVDSKA